MRRLSLLSGIASAACVIAISSSACAQEPKTFNIPPGSLRDGLNQFATQSDQQLFYSGELVAGLRTPGLRGRYLPSAALDQLLAGSGVGWSETRPGVIFLRPDRELVGAEVTVEEIIVTGSLLKSSGGIASPVIAIDRDALERRGFGTVAETLTDLPQNYAGSATPIVQLTTADRQGSNSVIATGVNLRGLGPSSTLVLVNGRRLAGTGFRGEFGDVSALPSAVVERVDVLLDGASALYGADAVAGVVNVIMRPSFEGQQSRVRIAAARGGAEDLMVSHLLGRAWSSGTAYLSYEYQETGALSSLDRAYTADGDLRPFGGSDRRDVFSAPGNLVAFSAAAGAFVSQFAIRPNASGLAQTPADFAAGETNRQAISLGVDLVPAIERQSVYGRVRQSLGDRVDLSVDLRWNKRDYEFAGAASVGLLTVTRANPFFVSPNGADSQSIAYSFIGDLGQTRQLGRSESIGITGGASVDLGRGWSLEAYLAAAEEDGDIQTLGRANTRFLNEALGTTANDPATPFSTARDGFFNPYGTGSANSRAVLDFIGVGFTKSLDHSEARSANLLLEGPAWALPGGELRVAIGAQVRTESFETQTTVFGSTASPVTTASPEQDREIAAVFAEARIPVFGPDNARRGLRSLEVSLAARLERYNDFGETTNPKVGVVWSPLSDLAVRASWGTSFRAASLPQIYDGEGASATFLSRADGNRVLSLYLVGGNPDLQPETAETFTIGFDYRPRDRFNLSANYFDTRFADRIARPVAENLAGALLDPALTTFVDLIDPATNPADLALIQNYLARPNFAPGATFPASTYGAIIDGRWINTGAVTVRGFDLSGRHSLTLGDSVVTLDASASYVLDYEAQSTPTAVTRHVVGEVGYPVKLRSRAGASWTRGDVGLSLHWNHVADYRDRAGARIDAWNTADAQARWSPSGEAFQGLQLTLSVQNVFDADPPFYNAPTGYGFDPGQASLLGRVFALQLTKRW